MGGIVVLDYIDRYGDDGIAGVNLVGTVSRLGGAATTEMLGRDFLELVSGLESSDAETSVRALDTFVRRCSHEGPHLMISGSSLGIMSSSHYMSVWHLTPGQSIIAMSSHDWRSRFSSPMVRRTR